MVHIKKKRLIITTPLEDATLLGMASTLKAYQLAWLINKTTALKLAKVADLHTELPSLVVSYNNHFLFATEHCTYRLIQNKSIMSKERTINYLVPSLKYIDFFFSIRDFTQTFDIDAFCSVMRTTDKITYIATLDLKVCKNKEHLFFD